MTNTADGAPTCCTAVLKLKLELELLLRGLEERVGREFLVPGIVMAEPELTSASVRAEETAFVELATALAGGDDWEVRSCRR